LLLPSISLTGENRRFPSKHSPIYFYAFPLAFFFRKYFN
jgi:hypothetical protein